MSSPVYNTMRKAQAAARYEMLHTGLKHVAIKTTMFDWEIHKDVPCYVVQLVVPTIIVDRVTGHPIKKSKKVPMGVHPDLMKWRKL